MMENSECTTSQAAFVTLSLHRYSVYILILMDFAALDLGSTFPMEKTPIAMLSYDRGTDRTLDVYFLSMDRPPQLYRARKIANAPFALAPLTSVGSPNSATTLTATRSVISQKTILVFQTDDGNITVIADEQE